jgi:hypothetical protein
MLTVQPLEMTAMADVANLVAESTSPREVTDLVYLAPIPNRSIARRH